MIVGRPLVRATATDRLGFTTRTKLDFQFPIFVETSLGVDEAHLLFNAIQDSLWLMDASMEDRALVGTNSSAIEDR